MFAKVGDRIVVRGHKMGQPDRHCVVLEVRDEHGGPPYVVQWDDSDHHQLYYPGSDASVLGDNKA